jgi:hypothetical protein
MLLRHCPTRHPCPGSHRLLASLCSSEWGTMHAQVFGMEAQDVKQRLANEHGIMVRHYAKKLLDGYIRISVGKPEQTDALIRALETFR